MALTNAFKNVVAEKNKTRMRIMIKDSMIIDPTFKLFDEMIQYAQERIEDLYDKHDNEVLDQDPRHWTKDYMNSQFVAVVYNFSKERLDLLKKIVTYLYQDKIHEIEKDRINEKAKINKRKTAEASLSVGGVVLAIAGIIAEEALLTAGGVALTIVGAGLLILDKES